eukprot:jgi/Mesvir1/22307/Mv02064-RA.1
MSLARYLQHVQGGDGFSPHIFDEHFAKYANEGYAAPVEPTAEAVPPPVPYGDITARQAEDFGVVMVDRDVLARIMRAVEEVERRKGLSVPPSLNSVYASEGGGWPGVTTDDGELVRMPSRLDLDYGTKLPPMMLPSDFERVMAPIYPGFRPVHGAGDSGGNERSDDAPKASAALAAAGPAAPSASTVPDASGDTGPDPITVASGASSSAGGPSSRTGAKTDIDKDEELWKLFDERGIKNRVEKMLEGKSVEEGEALKQNFLDVIHAADEDPASWDAIALAIASTLDAGGDAVKYAWKTGRNLLDAAGERLASGIVKLMFSKPTPVATALSDDLARADRIMSELDTLEYKGLGKRIEYANKVLDAMVKLEGYFSPEMKIYATDAHSMATEILNDPNSTDAGENIARIGKAINLIKTAVGDMAVYHAPKTIIPERTRLDAYNDLKALIENFGKSDPSDLQKRGKLTALGKDVVRMLDANSLPDFFPPKLAQNLRNIANILKSDQSGMTVETMENRRKSMIDVIKGVERIRTGF